MPRLLHRLLGLFLALPLLSWMATGVLFHVKHRYAEAYEQLEVPVSERWSEARLSPAEVIAAQGWQHAALAIHPDGRPLYVGSQGGQRVAVLASSGERVKEADEAMARAWALAAVARSPHAARYGQVEGSARPVLAHSLVGRAQGAAFAFHFSGGKTVTVDRVTGEVSQTGALNDFIDLTYRLHYLQWTPWKPVNIALVLVAAPLVVTLAATGLWLAGKKRPRS